MFNMRIIGRILLLMNLLAACKKTETQAPSVQIISPMANDTISLSDSIPIHAIIKDKNLKSYKIIIYNNYSRQILFKEEAMSINTSLTLDEKISFELNADTTVYMNILGLDKNGNTGKAGVQFFLKK